ncbi:MAG: SAM-dependent methyltransferase [Chloroflexi bacterium]|nr:SAM-dependent methyltransferase [Chloroflexota bacterium]
MNRLRLGASFRDPSGFVFKHNGVLYRQINQVYAAEYNRLMESGLYEKLVKAGLLVSHTESDQLPLEADLAYKVIQPQMVPFISYPYEWPFSMLKDAALATLSIQKRALKAGMSLKDASAYNIQFLAGKPMLIDTLSFETYQEGAPWVAYRQFCQHFLAPLALMAYTDVRLNELLRNHLDGIPLDLAARLLPWKTRLNPRLWMHIHLQARIQKQYAGKMIDQKRLQGRMSRQALIGLIDSLGESIHRLVWNSSGTVWAEYYGQTNYTEAAFVHKKQLVKEWSARVNPKVTWDLGGNTGMFSRVAEREDAVVVSFDIDLGAVEINYQQVKENKETGILPLILDLTNPSPAIGWDNRERDSLGQRGPADLILALALLHHIVIGNNVPLVQAAEFLSKTGHWLIVEFIPKVDSQVQIMIQSRKDIFSNYDQQGFEEAFGLCFDIVEQAQIPHSSRMLYLMRSRSL